VASSVKEQLVRVPSALVPQERYSVPQRERGVSRAWEQARQRPVLVPQVRLAQQVLERSALAAEQWEQQPVASTRAALAAVQRLRVPAFPALRFPGAHDEPFRPPRP
jgi:hypothetical protein